MNKRNPDFFLIGVDGKLAIDQETPMLWSDVLDFVGDAASEGKKIDYIIQVHNGVCEIRTREAVDYALGFLAVLGNNTDAESAFIARNTEEELQVAS